MSKLAHQVEITNESGSLKTGWSKDKNPQDPLNLGQFTDKIATLLIRVNEAKEKGASKNIVNNLIQQIALIAKEQKTFNNLNRKSYEAYLRTLK